MTRSITGTRRAAALLAGGAAAAVLLLSGCSAGQIAETAAIVPAVPGANQDAGSFRVRNALVEFKPGGYPKGATAPLEVRIFNDSGSPVTVRVTSPDAESVVFSGPASAAPAGTPSATPTTSATPSATATPSGTASATPSPQAPSGGPAEVPIAAGDFAAFPPTGGRVLQLVGLKQDLQPGNSVQVIFDFGNNVQIKLAVPLGVPLTAEPRGTGNPQEQEHR